jgi:hypothetical protein
MTVEENQLVTVRQFITNNKHKGVWPETESALRAIILDSDKNGFSKAVFRVNRRVLINPQIFYQIILEKNSK